MYLSRLILNPKSKLVQRDLADCQSFHRTIMFLFPQTSSARAARSDLGVLYRVEQATHEPRPPVVLLQSRVAPDWTKLRPGYVFEPDGGTENPACKQVGRIYESIRQGAVLRFRLRANPTRKISTKSGPNGERCNGTRVELRGEDAQIAWLRRKGEQGGFALLAVRADSAVPDVRVMSTGKLTGHRSDSVRPAGNGNARLTFASVLFEGELQVIDPNLFRRTLEEGIGPGKAYGLGLLSIGPPTR